MFTAYAIRHKPSGGFLPARWKRSRGFSFDEPSTDEFPRLFKSERSASMALSAWLRGEWKEKEYDHDEWSHTDYVIGASPVPVEGRKSSDMEIIAFRLVEVEP